MRLEPTTSHDRVGRSGIDGVLDSAEAAAILIDPVRATLEAANGPGRTLFHICESQPLPRPLDCAMPAMTRLRHIHATARPNGVESLSFLIGGAMTTLDATVALIEGSQGRTLMLVRSVGASREQSRETARISDAGTASALSAADPEAAMPAASPPALHADAETLGIIARRIREGGAPRRPPSGQDLMPYTPSAPPARPEPAHSEHALPEPARLETPGASALARIAHELKTPLSAIVAAAEIMRDERLGPMGNTRYLDYAGDIHKSARHALDVVDAMLDRGAAEAHTPSAVAIGALVEEVVSVMMPLAGAAFVKLAFRSGEGRLEVFADATALRQIVFNLVANALKFTLPGGEVHVMTGLLDNGSVYLVVRDTGQGMDEVALRQAFLGVSEGTRRNGGGFGFGLPLVRQLAERMGALLEADSAPGKGTAILLSFPHYHA